MPKKAEQPVPGTMDPKKRALIDAALGEHNKKYKGTEATFQDTEHAVNVEWIPTGCLSLDWIMGGGMPRGRIIEIFGNESGGKTTAALFIASAVQKAGGIVALVDAEHAYTQDYTAKCGVDCDNLILKQPFSAEEAFNLINDLVETGVVDLIILDSVAALVPEDERESELEDKQMAVLSRFMGRGMRMLTAKLAKTKTTVIMLNQLRAAMPKMGMGPTETTPGGKALRFFASIRLQTKKLKTLRDAKEEAYGTIMGVEAIKNKLCAPNRKCELQIMFGKGIYVAADIFEKGLIDGTIYMEGKSYKYKNKGGNEQSLGVGKEKAIEALAASEDYEHVRSVVSEKK